MLFRSLKAKEPLREFRFSLLLEASRLPGGVGEDELLLQGVVDCCIEEEGELVIIDYKTDNVRSDGEIAERAEHYRPQLMAYSAALSRIFKKPVKQCILFFLSVGREYEL